MTTLMQDVQARYRRKLAVLGIEDSGPQVDPDEPLAMQVARYRGDSVELERLLREEERGHRRQVEQERLEALRQSLLVSQRDPLRPVNAQPDLNVWEGPRDTFRDPKRRKAEPPASWITERR